jgi:hypothetical protein
VVPTVLAAHPATNQEGEHQLNVERMQNLFTRDAAGAATANFVFADAISK